MLSTPRKFSTLALAAAACLATSAHAIQPQKWTHSTEADFAAGEFDGVVVTNLGDLKLATASEELGELPEDVTVIYDIAVVGDTTYIAAGPEGKLLAFKAGQVQEVAAFADGQVFALSVQEMEGGAVVAAVSGTPARLVGFDDQGETTFDHALPEDIRYVWDIVTLSDDQGFMLATGGDGKVLHLDGQGQAVEVLDTAQANVLCLAQGRDGEIYAGTDTDGLIYRIDPDGSSFVVYDAGEPEIGAILVAEDGTVYAGTADAEQARPGRLELPAEEETGRPAPDAESDAPPATPPSELPAEPQPQPMDAEPAAEAAEEEVAQTPTTAEEAEADQTEPSNESAETPALSDSDDAVAPDAGPTAEQYDSLRDEVRKRLLEARKSGGSLSGKSANAATGSRSTRTARAASAASGDKSGNALYRIDPQGFVSEVFRESVMVLNLVQRPDGKILVGTGNEGQLYLVDPVAGETSVLNDLESQQLLALSLADNGVIVGGANPASLVALSDTTAERGSYTSAILDASQISLWGTFLLTAELSEDSVVTIETRSGNVADPEIADWSSWSEAQVLAYDASAEPLQPLELKVASPPARFLQYRLGLENPGDAPQGGPIVGKVELAYVMPNLRPAISSLTAAYPDFPGVDQAASPAMAINWDATDDNGDRLLFDLEYQPAGAAKTGGKWLTLAEDLADTSFEWDTRKLPDGRYQLRVTADDRLDNPGDMAMTARRLADPVLIDNTPPTAQDLEISVSGRAATLSGLAADAFSPIRAIAYCLDDAEQYTPILPEDLIYDSTNEAWSATLSDLLPGGHAVTVRINDARGNVTYASKLFEIK